ncbi:MAG: hypothetical protein MJ252_24625 [archaeon]|nr:hypothetical protein [archaeon]
MCGKGKQENTAGEGANAAPTEKDPYAKYKEKKLDSNDEVKNGPYEDDKRECRDCCCCIFFIVFIIAVIVVAYLGFYYGDPNLVLYPYDTDQHQCGRREVEDYKYVYFTAYQDDTKRLFNITGPEFKISARCVKDCEPEKELGNGTRIMKCYNPNKTDDYCHVNKSNYYEGIEGKIK